MASRRGLLSSANAKADDDSDAGESGGSRNWGITQAAALGPVPSASSCRWETDFRKVPRSGRYTQTKSVLQRATVGNGYVWLHDRCRDCGGGGWCLMLNDGGGMLAQDVDRRYAAVREQIGREPSVAALVVYDPDLYVLLWRLCGGLSAYQRARGVAPQVPPIFGAIDSDYDALRDALHREPVRADFVGRHRRLAKLIEQYYGSLR